MLKTKKKTISEFPDMGNWTYDGALIVRGLWEIENVFRSLNLENFLHQHLNFFQVKQMK